MLMAKMDQNRFHKIKKFNQKSVMNKFQMKEIIQRKALKIQNLSHIQNRAMTKTKMTEINQTSHQKKEENSQNRKKSKKIIEKVN